MTPKILPLLALPLLFLLISGPALGQRHREPEPDQLLKESAAAITGLRAVSYFGSYELDGSHPELLPGAEGQVLIEGRGRAKGLLRIDARFWYPGTDATRDLSFAVSNDKVVQAQHDTRIYYHGDRKQIALLVYPADLLLFSVFTATEPYGDIMDGSATYEGELPVEDVDCYVIRVRHGFPKAESLWYIGKDDLLPRRHDRTFEVGDATVTSTLIAHDLVANPAVEPGAFVMEAPEGYTSEEYKGPPELLAVGTTAPAWEIPTPDGKKISLESLRGKVVVLDFWATWCGPCKRAMPAVQKLHDRFQGKPVVVYGVSTFETGDPAGYMKEKGFTYGLLVKGDSAAADYKITGIPTFYVIDPRGTIIFAKKGYDAGEEEELVAIITQALGAG
jgi:peroxiredoxin